MVTASKRRFAGHRGEKDCSDLRAKSLPLYRICHIHAALSVAQGIRRATASPDKAACGAETALGLPAAFCPAKAGGLPKKPEAGAVALQGRRIGSEEEAAKEGARTSVRRDAHGTDRFAKLRRYGAFRQTQRLLSGTAHLNPPLAAGNSVRPALAAELDLRGVYGAGGVGVRGVGGRRAG